jgi:hypothetical protein
MLELIGGIVNAINFFGLWGVAGEAVDKTVEAGSSVKSALNEEQQKKIDLAYAEFCNLPRLPDLEETHILTADIATPGVCNLSWPQTVEKFLADPSGSLDDVKWRARSTSFGGKGWIGFAQEREVFTLFEQYVTINAAVMTVAQSVEEYFLVFQATAERNLNDSSPCMLTYTAKAWKPSKLLQIFFGSSEAKLEEVAENGLRDFVNAMRPEFELTNMKNSIASELDTLARLVDSGQLSTEEYEIAKRKILEA